MTRTGGRSGDTTAEVVLFGAVALILLAGLWALMPSSGNATARGAPAPVLYAAASQPVTSHPATSTAPTTQATRPWTPPRFAERQDDRNTMVRVIRGYGLDDPAVLKVMGTVPRHEFVPKARRNMAYYDSPLPIGHGQTISQPYMVAEMTRLLKLTPDSRVLEIGTGSGYQAAVLTGFTRHVRTVEIIPPLAEQASRRLKRLGYDVVEVRCADGYHGWPGGGSFDAIIVTCASGQIPPPLIRQLKPGGRMIIPVGRAFAVQSLMLVEKAKDGTVRSRSLMPVRFVPLTRERNEDR
jgi:protein-L-isoaspartate(D-aspartate) O-methyltransferase